MEWNKKKKTFSRLGMAYFAFMLTTYLAQTITGILWKLTGFEYEMEGHSAIILSMAEMYLIGFPVFYFLIKQVPEAEKQREETIGWGTIAIFFLISMGLMQAGNLIGSGLMAVLSGIMGKTISNGTVDALLKENFPVMIVSTAVIAPVFEELMYRKLLIDRIRDYGDRTAVLVSGVLFGLAHGNFFQFFYACFLGMLLAYVYLRTGKIRYPMFLHMMVNVAGGVIGGTFMKLSGQFPLMLLLTGFYALIILMLSIAGMVLLICLWNRRVFQEGSMELPLSNRLQVAFVNPGMLLFFAGCVFSFILSIIL